MEGSIRTLKSEKYGFNNPKERKWEMIQVSLFWKVCSTSVSFWRS
jgi:hypothetical protein